MRSEGSHAEPRERAEGEPVKGLPKPTNAFRRRAWVEFQRAIDPLSPPKPLKLGRK